MSEADDPKLINIAWTHPMLERFKAAYAQACLNKDRTDTFYFDGHEFVIGYAKYLIEYLEGEFK